MQGADEFETIATRHSVEIPKIKGSRFVADAYPVTTEDEARKGISSTVHQFPDATHHCFGYRLDADGIERSSDAGEPSGTAGAPILRQIVASGLTDVLVVVTRYYGGTKLGAGGLIRAYGAAAKAVLQEAKRRTVVREGLVDLEFDYDDTSPAMRTIEQFDARIVESSYGTATRLRVAVRRSRVDLFSAAFRDALGARGSIHRHG